jgi:hypothetical protein
MRILIKHWKSTLRFNIKKNSIVDERSLHSLTNATNIFRVEVISLIGITLYKILKRQLKRQCSIKLDNCFVAGKKNKFG